MNSTTGVITHVPQVCFDGSTIPVQRKVPATQSSLTNKVAELDPATTRIAGIDRVQAYIRGWKTRNECFLTHQVLPIVQANFPNQSWNEHLNASRVICMEVNKMSLHPEQFKGKSIKIGSCDNEYPFLKPEQYLKKIMCPFHLCIEMDEKSNNIQLLVVPGAILDKGGYKHVYGAWDFNIERRLENDRRKVKLDMQVAIVPQDDLSDTMKIHQEIAQKVKSDNIADVPVALKPSADTPSLNFVYKQKWFNTDADKAAIRGEIPLNMSSMLPHVPFTFKDKLAVISQVNKTLQSMHAQSYVHADIKPQNILIKITEDNRVKGCVNDFDWSNKIFTTNMTANFSYWDTLANQGIGTPLADYFGLTISLGEMLIPAFGYDEWNLVTRPTWLLDQNVCEEFTKRAVTEHFYAALSSSKNRVLNPLKNRFSMNKRLEPCYSLQELTDIISEYKKTHALQLLNEQLELLRRVENEMSIIIKALSLIKHVVAKDNTLCRNLSSYDVDDIKYDIRNINDPTELLRYFRSQLVPLTFDPEYVSKEIDNLASLSLL